MADADIALVRAIDLPWTSMEPSQFGSGPGTPAIYVLVRCDGSPHIRIDLFPSHEAEAYAFEEAIHWGRFVVIGWGEKCYIIDLATRKRSILSLGFYFAHFCPAEECLLIATGERILRFDADGTVAWQSDLLAIDGVTINNIRHDVIEGEGEWDPPGGWRPFRVDLGTGTILK
jgi:hypothetical protein